MRLTNRIRQQVQWLKLKHLNTVAKHQENIFPVDPAHAMCSTVLLCLHEKGNGLWAWGSWNLFMLASQNEIGNHVGPRCHSWNHCTHTVRQRSGHEEEQIFKWNRLAGCSMWWTCGHVARASANGRFHQENEARKCWMHLDVLRVVCQNELFHNLTSALRLGCCCGHVTRDTWGNGIWCSGWFSIGLRCANLVQQWLNHVLRTSFRKYARHRSHQTLQLRADLQKHQEESWWLITHYGAGSNHIIYFLITILPYNNVMYGI